MVGGKHENKGDAHDMIKYDGQCRCHEEGRGGMHVYYAPHDTDECRFLLQKKNS